MTTADEALRIGWNYQQDGALAQAEAVYHQVLQMSPHHPEARLLLGTVCLRQDKLPEAVAFLAEAVRRQPERADAHSNLGIALARQGRLDEALSCFREALRIKPDFVEAKANLAQALRDQVASATGARVRHLPPDAAERHDALGSELEAAIACCGRALELKPAFAEAHHGLGVALALQGQLKEAITSYQRALELKPGFAEARKRLGMVWLLMGNLEQGWSEYEWRLKERRAPVRAFPQPLWDGAPLPGRTILVHTEGGSGDILQFVRFASAIKQRGATVVVECPRRLLGLLATCHGIDRLIA
jgi:tetratricopeptide (TPR) repeat protein